MRHQSHGGAPLRPSSAVEEVRLNEAIEDISDDEYFVFEWTNAPNWFSVSMHWRGSPAGCGPTTTFEFYLRHARRLLRSGPFTPEPQEGLVPRVTPLSFHWTKVVVALMVL